MLHDTNLDQSVRALVAAGDHAGAVTVVTRTLASEVRGYLAGVLRNDIDVEDVLAATNIRLWESLARFEWRCSIRTWTYVIARHEAHRFRRAGRKHARGRVSMSVLSGIARAGSGPASALGSARRRDLSRLREELSPDDRELLILRIDRGLPWDDIALAFVRSPEKHTDDERRRMAARLRQRFKTIKARLAARAREAQPVP